MYRIDAADNTAVLPVKGSVGTEGYATDGPPATVWDHHTFNAHQEEIAGAIEAAGDTLLFSDHTQLEVALGAGSMRAHATDTGSVTTAKTCVVLACATSQSTTAKAVCIASTSVIASGSGSAAIASFDLEVSGVKSVALATDRLSVSGHHSAVIACDGGDGTASGNHFTLISCDIANGAHTTLAGDACVAIGCDADVTSNLVFTSGAARCVAIAGRGGTLGASAGFSALIACNAAEITDGSWNAIIAGGAAAVGDARITSSGSNNMVAASSYGLVVSTAAQCAVIACGQAGSTTPTIGSNVASSMIVASVGDMQIATAGKSANFMAANLNALANPTVISGSTCFVMGVNGPCTVSGGRSAIVCSSTSGAGPTLSDNDVLAGATGTSITWQLHSGTGRGTFQKLTISDRSTDTAAGAAAHIGLPTGSTLTQSAWIKINDGVNDVWIPGWTA